MKKNIEDIYNQALSLISVSEVRGCISKRTRTINSSKMSNYVVYIDSLIAKYIENNNTLTSDINFGIGISYKPQDDTIGYQLNCKNLITTLVYYYDYTVEDINKLKAVVDINPLILRNIIIESNKYKDTTNRKVRSSIDKLEDYKLIYNDLEKELDIYYKES